MKLFINRVIGCLLISLLVSALIICFMFRERLGWLIFCFLETVLVIGLLSLLSDIDLFFTNKSLY